MFTSGAADTVATEHVLRNAMLPVVTVLALDVGYLLGNRAE